MDYQSHILQKTGFPMYDFNVLYVTFQERRPALTILFMMYVVSYHFYTQSCRPRDILNHVFTLIVDFRVCEDKYDTTGHTCETE